MPDYESSPFANPLPGTEPELPVPAASTDPFGGPASWAAPAVPPPPPRANSNALYDLRPLSLGEILDRTFSIYKKRFWLFAGISMVPAVFASLIMLLSFIPGTAFSKTPTPPIATTPDPMKMAGIFAVAGLAGFIFFFIYLVGYGLTQAATVSAVSAVYTGEEASIGIAWRSVKGKWWRYALIMMWQFWSAVWLTVVLIVPAIFLLRVPSLSTIGGLLMVLAVLSMFYAPFPAIRNSLGVIACAIESLTVRQSMRRSKFLVSGHKARVLGILLLLAALGIASGVLQELIAVPALLVTGPLKYVLQGALLVVHFCMTALVTPVGPIALCLFYIDERVRKEGFDVELLMLRGGEPAALPPEQTPSPFTSELA